MRRSIISIVFIVAFALSLFAPAGLVLASKKILPGAVDPVLPSTAMLGGKSLTEWTAEYWRWWFTEYAMGDQTQKMIGRTLLMPMPSGDQVTWESGSWTPEDPAILRGRIEVTLKAGTPFVLPLFGWLLERYVDSTVDPPFDYPDPLKTIISYPGDTNRVPLVTLDGRTVLKDFWEHYVGPEPFDPEIGYPYPGWSGTEDAVGMAGFQGVTIIVTPLTPGTHVLTLYEQMIAPDMFGVIYENTWFITVQ
jgi:hypothetical protein